MLLWLDNGRRSEPLMIHGSAPVPGQPPMRQPRSSHGPLQAGLGPVINWNYYRFSPGQEPEVLRLRQAFFDYLDKRFVQTGDFAPLHLAAGDCMVFHDLRVVHGREAYEAERAGDRCLWNMNLHWNGG